MSTLTTLFGGMVAVLVFYFALGFARALPPMLRAALAALIPLTGYFIYIIGGWPGLDVVAIHISVFIGTAMVLNALSKFWLRGGRLHWVPKALIGFFIGLAIINATLLHIATSGLPGKIGRWWLGSEGPVYSGFSGIVTHDQGAAKAVSAALSEAHRESQLGWRVDVEGVRHELATVSPVAVRVRDRTGLPVNALSARVELSRLGAASPAAVIELQQADAGLYRGELNFPAAGRWLVAIRLDQGADARYREAFEVIVP